MTTIANLILSISFSDVASWSLILLLTSVNGSPWEEKKREQGTFVCKFNLQCLTLIPNKEFLRICSPRGQNPPKLWSDTPGIWTPDMRHTGRPTPHYTTTVCYAWLSILRQAYSLYPFFQWKTFTPGGTRIIPCKILWYLEVLGLIDCYEYQSVSKQGKKRKASILLGRLESATEISQSTVYSLTKCKIKTKNTCLDLVESI